MSHAPPSAADWLPFTHPRTKRPTVLDSAEQDPRRSGAPGPAGSRRVRIDPFWVCDEAVPDMVGHIVQGALAVAGTRPYVAFALHVGGLNARAEVDFRAAMAAADAIYADGMSVVWLARLAGARRLQRAGTTDLGWDLMREMGQALGRPARVALVGGPQGLTERAGRVLAAGAGVQVVAAEHGYHDDWSPVLERVRAAGCDVLIVGMGAPREMTWVHRHRAELPPCLVLTCGGWFSFLTQDEKRAPLWMQKTGLEWSYRVAQAPRRLAGRYAVGAITTARLALPQLRQRRRAHEAGSAA